MGFSGWYYLCCSKYCANWICLGVPEIVIIRSVDPWAGSSIVMNAFDSIRILRIRCPAFPMIAPANYITKHKWLACVENPKNRQAKLLCISMATYIFRNCDLCSLSSLIILSIIAHIVGQIISHGIISAEIIVHTKNWPVISTQAVIKCTVVAHVWIVSESIESI